MQQDSTWLGTCDQSAIRPVQTLAAWLAGVGEATNWPKHSIFTAHISHICRGRTGRTEWAHWPWDSQVA